MPTKLNKKISLNKESKKKKGTKDTKPSKKMARKQKKEMLGKNISNQEVESEAPKKRSLQKGLSETQFRATERSIDAVKGNVETQHKKRKLDSMCLENGCTNKKIKRKKQKHDRQQRDKESNLSNSQHELHNIIAAKKSKMSNSQEELHKVTAKKSKMSSSQQELLKTTTDKSGMLSSQQELHTSTKKEVTMKKTKKLPSQNGSSSASSTMEGTVADNKSFLPYFNKMAKPPAAFVRKALGKVTPATEPHSKHRRVFIQRAPNSEPAKKKVQFVLKRNIQHPHKDYKPTVQNNPSLPFNKDKKPRQSLLKPTLLAF